MMIIDSEFESLIPPLTDEEYKGLEESILEEGCRDALVVWGDILIDGHNRYNICTDHGLPFKTVQREFADRDEVKLWIMKNQLSRRNLNDFQRIEITHKCEDAVKAKAKERQGTRNDLQTSGQNSPEVEQKEKRATDELGEMAGVSRKTYEHAVEVLDKAPEPVVEATRNEELSINAAYEVTKLPEEEQTEIAERIEQGEKPKDVVADVKKRPHVSYNNGKSEWYTPSEYIELAREVMGKIDLDPASTEIANKVVQADIFYTVENNGLEHTWSGNVWLNPPYASEAIVKFADKLIKELEHISQAIMLVNNATETDWFCKLVEHASAVCFPKGRVKFYDPDGKTATPLQGQAILYFGSYPQMFVDAFYHKGWCALLNAVSR